MAKQSVSRNESPAIADDFNSPPVRDAYEQFIGLVVMAGMKDRLKALNIRKTQGVEAAVRFLADCSLIDTETDAREIGTNEAVAKRIDAALICVETARRLTDVCQAAVKAMGCEHSIDVAFTMGNELFGALDDARMALEGETEPEHAQ